MARAAAATPRGETTMAPTAAATPPGATTTARTAAAATGTASTSPADRAAPQEKADRPTLTPSEVAAVISSRRAAFDGCVADWIRRKPQFDVTAVKVDLFITINPTGTVTNPALDNPDIDGSTLGACLKAAGEKLVFPRFGGEAIDVRIPLVLGEMAQ